MTRKAKAPVSKLPPDDIRFKIGERLKFLRRQKGYSNYEKFAHEKDLSRSQYGKYEKGEDLRLSSLIKVLKALDITLKEFFSEGID